MLSIFEKKFTLSLHMVLEQLQIWHSQYPSGQVSTLVVSARVPQLNAAG